MRQALLDEDDNDFSEDEDQSKPEENLMRRRTFPRTLTDPLAHVIDYITDTDGEWTQQLLENYGKIDDKGHDGDVPEQPAFATDLTFWTMVVLALGMGAILGLSALVFMNIIDEVNSSFST